MQTPKALPAGARKRKKAAHPPRRSLCKGVQTEAANKAQKNSTSTGKAIREITALNAVSFGYFSIVLLEPLTAAISSWYRRYACRTSGRKESIPSARHTSVVVR